MSVSLMTLVWRIEFPTQSQKLIALKLADHSNDEGGNIWPSKARVSREAGCSETTVQLTLRVFRECGLLEVAEEGGKGPGHTTKYRLNVEMLEALAKKEAVINGSAERLEVFHTCGEKGSESDGVGIRWDRSTGLKGSDCPQKGVGITDPKPSLKNHKEPSAREGSKFDFESEVVAVAERIAKAETVPDVDRAWAEVKARKSLYPVAEYQRLKVAANRRFGELTSPKPPIDLAARMTGEGVAK